MGAHENNRLALAMTLADAWAHFASSCDNLDETPAEVHTFAEGADDHEWSIVENLVGRTTPVSDETRAATLTVLASRAATPDGDPFASFTRDNL